MGLLNSILYILSALLFTIGSILFHPQFTESNIYSTLSAVAFIIGSGLLIIADSNQLYKQLNSNNNNNNNIVDNSDTNSINSPLIEFDSNNNNNNNSNDDNINNNLIQSRSFVLLAENNQFNNNNFSSSGTGSPSKSISLCLLTINFNSNLLFLIGSIAFIPFYSNTGFLLGNWLFLIGSVNYFITSIISSYKFQLHLITVFSIIGSLGFIIGCIYSLTINNNIYIGFYSWLIGSLAYSISALTVIIQSKFK